MRAHTSSPRTLLGNTDHADIVHLPDTRGADPPFARVDPISTTQDRFATANHDPHASVLIGDAGITGGTRVKLIKTEDYENGNREQGTGNRGSQGVTVPCSPFPVPSFTHGFDDNSLGTLTVPLSVEHPLPRPEIELPLRDRHDHLVPDRE